MLTRRALEKLLLGVKEKLTELGFEPERMILFGSYANGGIHKYSDVDIAVWNKNFTGIGMEDFEKIKPVRRAFPMVDIKAYHSLDTKDTDPFIAVIEKTGKEIGVAEVELVN